MHQLSHSLFPASTCHQQLCTPPIIQCLKCKEHCREQMWWYFTLQQSFINVFLILYIITQGGCILIHYHTSIQVHWLNDSGGYFRLVYVAQLSQITHSYIARPNQLNHWNLLSGVVDEDPSNSTLLD